MVIIHRFITAAAVAGVAGWLWAWLIARSSKTSDGDTPRVNGLIATAAVLLAFAAVLETRWPRPGDLSQWAAGVLLGAAAGLIAAWTATWIAPGAPGETSRRDAPAGTSGAGDVAAITAPQFLSVATVAVPVLWNGGPFVEAIVAIPVGWLASTFAVTVLAARTSDDVAAARVRMCGLGFAVTLAATAALAIYRDKGAGTALPWTAAALAAGAAIPLATLVGALASIRIRRAAVHLVVAAVVFSMLAAGASRQLLGQPLLLPLIVLGLGLGVILWWLAGEGDGETAGGALLADAVAALVVLATFMSAFGRLAGFGVGMLLLSAWLVCNVAVRRSLWDRGGPARMETAVRRLFAPLAIGIVLLLYRLVATRFPADLEGVGLSDHFALVGFLAGAVTPALLAGFVAQESPGGRTVRFVRVALAFVLVAAIPGVMVVLWSTKIAIALLAGLMLSVFARGVAQGERPAAGLLVPPLAVLMAAGLALWLHPLAQLALQARAERIHLLARVLALLIAAIALTDIGPRLKALRRGRGETAGPAGRTAVEGGSR